jgi:hypothetical protein
MIPFCCGAPAGNLFPAFGLQSSAFAMICFGCSASSRIHLIPRCMFFSGEEDGRGKPHPDVFASRCVFFLLESRANIL